jgi:amino acid adenylation domain-containing protein
MLSQGFLKSVQAFGDRPALEVGGVAQSYNALFRRSASLAATLSRYQIEGADDPPLTAIFAYRSVTAFSGVLAALLRGHGYVPLNRTFPLERTKTMLQRSGCRAMIVDGESEKQLDYLLEASGESLLVILPESNDVEALAKRFPKHRFIGAAGLVSHEEWKPVEVSQDAVAYVLFTSGSTGVPKGVIVAQRNVRHYVDFICERFKVGPEDRFSQTFDMTFDLSVGDMFVTWERGACLCCPSEKMLLNPGRFIKEARLTFWFSVPSTAVFMKRLGSLKPESYPNLRVSLFCGEALPADVAKAWAEAAPNSIVENIYGPTELTIACTYYRWDSARSLAESEHGIVPIGESFPGMAALVADESLQEVAPGEAGELLMTGPQLSLGYLNDPSTTAKAFVKPPGRNEVYYRTGDRVRRPTDGKPMTYLGRMDNQVKVLGHRVELGEIEAVIREVSGVDGVVALGWPVTSSGAQGIEAFLQADHYDTAALTEKIRSRLPTYMTPRSIRVLPQFPLNANGKFDRKALLEILRTK